MGIKPCRRKTLGALLLVQLCLVLAGCASVRIENADVLERRYPGFVVLSVTPRPDGAAIVRSQGVGLMVGMTGTTIGYMNESAFVTFDPKACRLFIAVETEAQVDALVKALAGEVLAREVCAINKTGEKK